MIEPPLLWDWQSAYDDLTVKQQSIVDSWVELMMEGSAVTHSEVGENAACHHPNGEAANSSYVATVIRNPENRMVAEEKLRAEGGEPMRTEPDSGEPDPDLAPLEAVMDGGGEDYVVVPISVDEVEDLLVRDEVPDALAERILGTMWDSMFSR